MKFVKYITLFFIYPLAMFAIGFASNMAIMEFFYPGEQIAAQPSDSSVHSGETAVNGPKPDKEETELLQVAMSEEPVMTANTRYVVQEFYGTDAQTKEEEVKAPDKFIGLGRDSLVDEIEEYNHNPSLTDLEQGFTSMELVSFSPERVVVRKSYQPEAEEEGFFLLNEDHYVVVYNHNLSDIYMNTDILVEGLPESLQAEILKMKFVEDERELYNFLESYSS